MRTIIVKGIFTNKTEPQAKAAIKEFINKLEGLLYCDVTAQNSTKKEKIIATRIAKALNKEV